MSKQAGLVATSVTYEPAEPRASYELDMGAKGTLAAEFGKAVKRAHEDERITYVTRDGERIAAVVPASLGANVDPDVPHDPRWLASK